MSTLQSLSVAGLAGGLGLVAYVFVLVRSSYERAVTTRGLAPALMFIIAARMLTEVPLNLGAILLGDTVLHVVLFKLLVSPIMAPAVSPLRSHETAAVQP